MAIKIPGLKLLVGADAKSRVFLVFAAITAIGFAGYFLMRYLGGGGTATGPSKIAAAPSSLQSVPGAQMSPEFYRAVEQANAQAAQQATVSGGSAVPTLVNMSGQQTGGMPTANCTVLCPGDEGANVADDINNLVKEGKLSQDDANRLLNLAKANVSVEEYAAALNELVKQGKLTPEQARQLLEKYKKQNANNKLASSGQLMDNMIKSGQLPIDVANQLLALQKMGVSPADYAAELNRLVKEGKLTPAAAAQLLAQYTQQHLREQAKENAFKLQQMAKAGQITPEVAKHLAEMQARNVPADQYRAELDRLVAAGKITPAAAAKLIEQYKAQKEGLGAAGTLSSLVTQEEANAAGVLSDLVKSGKLSQSAANDLALLQQKGVNVAAYQNALDKLVQEKKISPEEAQRLLESYKKLAAVRGESQHLATLQANNASTGDYANELKRAVQAGLISPEMAATLLAQYRALSTPMAMPTGTAPGIDASVPGAEEFAQLQQRIQTAPSSETTSADIGQFTAAATQSQLETLQERQQRLEQMQNAMSAQADKLINAWQPVKMEHKEAAPPLKSKSGLISDKDKDESKSSKAATKPLIKAGTILFAVLDTAADSDYPDSPVMATIVQGDLKGAKLLGKLQIAQSPNQDRDRMSLKFELMNKDEWTSGKTIRAFAIDPDTARTVMASSVDYHYLKRYGAMMASSFMTGYANAITQEGSSTTGIFGTSTTHPALSPGQKIAVGLGQVGTTMGGAMSSYINTPPTVRVNSGVGLGILFMDDVAS